MSNNNFYDVGVFRLKFGLGRTTLGPISLAKPPKPLESGLSSFRIDLMEEELQEYIVASANKDFPGMADALIDLVYVAMGTAHEHSFQWQELWDEVQRANITKMKAPNADASKRHWGGDIIKPEHWVGPDIKGVLRRQGWKG